MSRFYLASGIISGMMIIAVCVLIIAQIVARPMGYTLPGADEFAIGAFVAAVFLGLPYTLHSGGHVRADVIVQMLAPVWQRRMEIIVHLVALAFIAFFASYAADLAWSSYLRKTRFQGLLGSPLWIPQSSIVVGLALFWLALVLNLVRVLRQHPDTFGEGPAERGGVE